MIISRLSESGWSGLKDVQDEKLWLSDIFRGFHQYYWFVSILTPNYILDFLTCCNYNKLIMKIEYDPNKNQRNITKRKLSFDLVEQFELDTALIWEDDRYDYDEIRYCALGYIENGIFHLAFTYRGDTIRVISLRKANKREVKRYAET